MQKADCIHQMNYNIPDPVFIGHARVHVPPQLEQVQVASFNYEVAEGRTGDLNLPETHEKIGMFQVFQDFSFRGILRFFLGAHLLLAC